MFSYTIGDTTYYASNDRLFVERDETHDVDQIAEIEGHPLYLYDYRDIDDEEPEVDLVRFEVWGGKLGGPRRVKTIPYDDEGRPSRHIDAPDFSGATPVDTLTPEEIQECPECGSWAGGKGEEPYCLNCGHGIEDRTKAPEEEV